MYSHSLIYVLEIQPANTVHSISFVFRLTRTLVLQRSYHIRQLHARYFRSFFVFPQYLTFDWGTHQSLFYLAQHSSSITWHHEHLKGRSWKAIESMALSSRHGDSRHKWAPAKFQTPPFLGSSNDVVRLSLTANLLQFRVVIVFLAPDQCMHEH